MSDDDKKQVELPDFEAMLRPVFDELAALRQAFVEGGKNDGEDAGDAGPSDADIAAAAKRAGIDPKKYAAALTAAKRETFRDEHRDTIRELFQEMLDELVDDDDDAAGAADGDDGDDRGKRKPKAKADDDDDDDAGGDDDDDSPPVVEHWSDRKFSSLFGFGS